MLQRPIKCTENEISDSSRVRLMLNHSALFFPLLSFNNSIKHNCNGHTNEVGDNSTWSPACPSSTALRADFSTRIAVGLFRKISRHHLTVSCSNFSTYTEINENQLLQNYWLNVQACECSRSKLK